MSELILPCPACGKDRADPAHRHHEQYSVICPDCYMLGPSCETQQAAIAAWNALPRALPWTNETPRVAGWYWWRSGPGQNATTIRVHENIRAVLFGEPCDPEEKVIGYWDQNDTFRTDLGRGEWAGPIAPPAE